MEEQWIEIGDRTRFDATAEHEKFAVGQSFINLAFIERIEFISTSSSGETWTQARLYRPGEAEPAYRLNAIDSRTLAHRLRQALPPVPLAEAVRRRPANLFNRIRKDPPAEDSPND